MYKDMLRAYIYEFLTFIFVAAVVICGICISGCVEFHWSVLLVELLIVFTLWLFVCVFPFALFSVCVIVDAALNDYVEKEAVFLEQFPYKATAFSEKYRKGSEKVRIEATRETYYRIIADADNQKITFTSSAYYELKPRRTYVFVYARRSQALVDVKDKSQR